MRVGGVSTSPEDGDDSDRFGDQLRGAAINGISFHTNGSRRQIACCLISATPASIQTVRQTDRQTDRHQYFGTVSVLVISTAELGNKESILVVHVENARTRPSTPLPGKPYIFLLVYEYEYKLNLVMAPLGGKPRLLILECLR